MSKNKETGFGRVNSVAGFGPVDVGSNPAGVIFLYLPFFTMG